MDEGKGGDKQSEVVRQLYHRQLQTPQPSAQQLLQEYEQWEQEHGQVSAAVAGVIACITFSHTSSGLPELYFVLASSPLYVFHQWVSWALTQAHASSGINLVSSQCSSLCFWCGCTQPNSQ